MKRAHALRRVRRLIDMEPKTYRYAAMTRTRASGSGFWPACAVGYRRLLILLRREGIELNHKKLFRLSRFGRGELQVYQSRCG
jgi:putative transposase